MARRGELLPPVDEALLQDYVLAGNGIFTRGRRPGLEACIPIADAPVRGLRPVDPYVAFGYPKVPAQILALIFQISQTIAKKEPRETLFHLSFDPPAIAGGSDRSGPLATAGGTDKNADLPPAPAACPCHLLCAAGWHLEFPRQQGTADHVEAIEKGAGTSEERAVIEVHSHHEMDPVFSPTDDADEGTMSFRLYGVIGTIFSNPSIRVRVGLFGHFYEYPASEFFELPEGVSDCVTWEIRQEGKG